MHTSNMHSSHTIHNIAISQLAIIHTSIATYQCQLFIPLKRVFFLDDSEESYENGNSIYNFFLWHGNADCLNIDTIQYDVCRSKKEGGLGLKNMQLLNLATIGKITWHINAKKDSL